MLDLKRSIDHFDPKQAPGAHIIGAGATGSRIFEQLFSLGVDPIYVWDFDKVEPHNIGNQLFVAEDIGQSKVGGLKRWAKRKDPTYLGKNKYFDNKYLGYAHGEYCNPKYFAGRGRGSTQSVAFLLVDSMKARRECYEHIKYSGFIYNYIIETRMGASHGFCYTFNVHDMHQRQRWEDTLFDDKDAKDTGACGSQITVASTAQLLSSMAVSTFINIAKAGDVPFYQGIYTDPFLLERED